MKKLLAALAIIGILVVTSSSSWAGTGGSVTTGKPTIKGNVTYLPVSIIANTDGTIPSTIMTQPVDGILLGVRTIPDGVKPMTNNTSFTLTNSDSEDVMGGALASRSSTLKQFEPPWAGASSTPMPRAVLGYLTVNGTGNSVDGGKVKLVLEILK